jgi:hypothetical protein
MLLKNLDLLNFVWINISDNLSENLIIRFVQLCALFFNTCCSGCSINCYSPGFGGKYKIEVNNSQIKEMFFSNVNISNILSFLTM